MRFHVGRELKRVPFAQVVLVTIELARGSPKLLHAGQVNGVSAGSLSIQKSATATDAAEQQARCALFDQECLLREPTLSVRVKLKIACIKDALATSWMSP